MNPSEIRDILLNVSFLDWEFVVEQKGEQMYLQTRFVENDIVTGEPALQAGRKWILSKHMTKSEVVTTAFKAVLTATEHEVREQFRYRGRMIFGPHFNVDVLHTAAARANMDVRQDPTSVMED